MRRSLAYERGRADAEAWLKQWKAQRRGWPKPAYPECPYGGRMPYCAYAMWPDAREWRAGFTRVIDDYWGPR